MKEFSHRVDKCLEAETSQESFDDLRGFLEGLQALDKIASKGTHYDRLSEWSDAVYAYVHNKLEKYDFIQASKEQNQDATFWFLIYQVVGNVCYSKHMKSQTAVHHSSAWERNRALIADIEDILEFKSKDTIKRNET